MVGESDQNVFFIEIDASSFAEFEISEFEIPRLDCIRASLQDKGRYQKAKFAIFN